MQFTEEQMGKIVLAAHAGLNLSISLDQLLHAREPGSDWLESKSTLSEALYEVIEILSEVAEESVD